MNKIQILSDELIQKIAAGEVIERPASVVKELVENSIDAGATYISVEILNEGKRLIRVVDNGIGMNRADMEICIKKHSTSKITSFEDLFYLHTLGFRGEALASIASISKLEIMSKPQVLFGEKSVLSGTLLKVENAEEEINDIGCSEGTTITVKDLFYNVPARLKFLRSPTTELGHINDTIFKFALSHPEISFKFSHNKSELLNVPVTKKYEERILALFNKVWLENMIKTEHTEGFLKLTGYISKPEFTRTLNTNQWLFLNKRPIQNKLVSHAVGQGYGELLPKGRTPVFVLFMELEGSEFDVNVHPTKREVKFIHSTQVHQEIADKIRKTLQNARLIPKINLEKIPVLQDIKNNVSYAQYKPLDIIQERKDEISETIREYQASFDKDPVGEKVSATIEELMPIAQLNEKYILARHKNGLIIIDQHAAHEKIMYEKLISYDAHKQPQQGLLSPVNIEFDFKTSQTLLENIALFNEVGFDIEKFGKNVFILRAVPINFKGIDYKEILLTILEELSETEIPQPKKKDAIFKTIACHSSVRSGDKLEFVEMENLLKEFQKLKIPYCPHGRPASLNLTYGELDVRFGRK